MTFYGYDPGFPALVVRTGGGINDGPPVRTSAVPRPNGHGDFPAPTTRGARAMPGEGWCRATSEAGLLLLRNTLMGILTSTQNGDFTINEFGVVRVVKDAEVYGTPTFERQGSSLKAEWSLVLRATDPLLYDDGLGAGHW